MNVIIKLTAVVLVLGYVTLMSWLAVFECGTIPLGYWVFIGCMAIITTVYSLLSKDYYN